jgi:hypothetical protein
LPVDADHRLIERLAMTARLGVAVLLVLLLSACGSSPAADGEPCREDDDCEGALCFDPSGAGTGTCTRVCGDGATCPDGTSCGTLADGGRACLGACDEYSNTIDRFVCVSGAQVACERAGAAASCWLCGGCPSEMFCPSTRDDLVTCQPDRAQGESCRSNDECVSGNCSVHDRYDGAPGRCLLPHGAACASGGGDCLSCDVTLEGEVCSKGCRSLDRCGDGDECIGREDSGYFCRPSCASTQCPAYWTCEITRDGSTVYCEPPRRCDPTATIPCGLLGTCHPELRVCY